MSDAPPKPGWRTRVRGGFERGVIRGDDWVDAAFTRFNKRFGRNQPRHIAAYRGFADEQGVELIGRVLAQEPLGGPGEHDDWWDNLLNTYRRFESDEVPDAAGEAALPRRRPSTTATDHEGYYAAGFMPPRCAPAMRCGRTRASRSADGTLDTPQPVLQVLPTRALRHHLRHRRHRPAEQHHRLEDRRAADLPAQRAHAQAAARRGEAVRGAAGRRGHAANPIFYVSSSPWNLYDLLDDFMELNAIPPGPIFLRDIGTDTGKFIKTPGHGHKLERARMLIERMPQLALGPARRFRPGRRRAVRRGRAGIRRPHRRDLHPRRRPRRRRQRVDTGADAWIENVAGTKVPMLRVNDSLAIAEHAATLGLMDPAAIPGIIAEVRKDAARPTPTEAAVEETVEQAKPE